jgi:hypothetical protein
MIHWDAEPENQRLASPLCCKRPLGDEVADVATSKEKIERDALWVSNRSYSPQEAGLVLQVQPFHFVVGEGDIKRREGAGGLFEGCRAY